MCGEDVVVSEGSVGGSDEVKAWKVNPFEEEVDGVVARVF